MATNPLTEKRIRDLDLSDLEGKSEKRFWDDQDGLCLRVRARGDTITRCYWVHYRYRNADKKLAIGSTSETTLADARHRAYEIRRDAKDGVDPREKRRPKAAETLSQAVTDYLSYIKPRKSKSTIRQNELYLQRGSYFGELHKSGGIDKITQADVANCLRAIEKKYGISTAHGARAMLRRFYVWLNQEGRFPEGFYSPVQGTAPPADRNFKNSRLRIRRLEDGELVEVWNKSGDESERYGRIIRLLILTGCRRQEVGGMRKAELDLANCKWTIPAARYKTRKDHTVYLGKAAVEIIEAALAVAPTEGVFETIKVGKAGHPRQVPGFQDWSFYKSALDAALGDSVDKWVVHDLRRTMRSGLGMLKVPPHIAEMAIGHAQPVIVNNYDQHRYVDELRDAFERWATHIEQLLGTNVVELRHA